MADDEVHWLNEGEHLAWLETLRLTAVLPAAVEAQLQRDAGLSLFEYLVLAMLSEQPGRIVQLKALAILAGGSQSRLSHVLTRLERRDFVRRYPSPEDGRITLAALTDDGWDVMVATAPAHVATVRRLVFDALSPTQIGALRTIAQRINARACTSP